MHTGKNKKNKKKRDFACECGSVKGGGEEGESEGEKLHEQLTRLCENRKFLL